MQPATWRLVLSPPLSGALNMAVDEAVLESVGQGLSLPTLRLYAWDPPCLSLGYAQPGTDLDLPSLQQRGWQFVRRPTGGRAILHTDELTYAVIAPPDEPRVSGSVLESYQRLSMALLRALQLLGAQPHAEEKAPAPNPSGPGPVCFEVPSNFEITVEGKKLVGSAQARRKEGVLQHGSLPLVGDLTRITQGLAFPDEAARARAAERLLQRATTLEAVLHRRVSWDEAAQAFQEAFSQTLGLSFQPDALSPHEWARAQTLSAEKYSDPAWLLRPLSAPKPTA